MIQVGRWNNLEVIRQVPFGVYLNDGQEGILLPVRYVPKGVEIGDMLHVFVYHDSEDRLIATTQEPKGVVGDIVKLKCMSTTPQGAFLDWGLMKDIFVPRSQQLQAMRPMGEYLVKIYLDERTGRVAATERFQNNFSNENITLKVKDKVDLTVLRRSDIGYVVAINNQHTGVLHHNEVYRAIAVGDRFPGFIKNIYEDGGIDVVAGEVGYNRVESESDKILRMLKENKGFLPYHDKSDPEEIYLQFSMSKKTFKMALGNLYKAGKILLQKDGISLKS